MNIKKIVKDLRGTVIQFGKCEDVMSISYDSRKVKRQALFVCVKGDNSNGHDYIDEVIAKGAVAIIIEDEISIENDNITIIKVDNARKALSYVSNVFYNRPSNSLDVVGITGTNGKTSISFLISEILQANEEKVGVIGTIGMQVNNKPLPIEKTTPTTPDSLELQMVLREMVDVGATKLVMEVTSIGLDQQRVNDCKIDIGVFTNLTEDHLDFHGTMEKYKEAKKQLFKLCKIGVINTDDLAGCEFVSTMLERKKEDSSIEVITYAIDKNADLRAENVVLTPFGSRFNITYKMKSYSVNINLPGKFNIYNTLAAIGAALQLGVSMDVIIKALEVIKGAKGRFESVVSDRGYTAVVDYAHTPDALENVLITAKEFKPNRIITVFGCGGDRDKTKRPMMGKISGELSDFTIITSDNPRTENPTQILSDVENGVKQTNGYYEIIEDRKDAITKALGLAGKNDIVIIAGKGHETYQIIGNEIIHFDDMEIVQEYVNL